MFQLILSRLGLCAFSLACPNWHGRLRLDVPDIEATAQALAQHADACEPPLYYPHAFQIPLRLLSHDFHGRPGRGIQRDAAEVPEAREAHAGILSEAE